MARFLTNSKFHFANLREKFNFLGDPLNPQLQAALQSAADAFDKLQQPGGFLNQFFNIPTTRLTRPPRFPVAAQMNDPSGSGFANTLNPPNFSSFNQPMNAQEETLAPIQPFGQADGFSSRPAVRTRPPRIFGANPNPSDDGAFETQPPQFNQLSEDYTARPDSMTSQLWLQPQNAQFGNVYTPTPGPMASLLPQQQTLNPASKF